MSDRQIRLLRWVSTMMDQLSKPEVRRLLTEAQLEMFLTRGKTLVNAEIALETTYEVEEIGVAKDLDELEKIFSLE